MADQQTNVDNQTQTQQTNNDVFALLNDEYKALDTAGKFKGKDANELFKSYVELEKSYHSKQEGMVKIPTSESPENERKAFYTQLGVPESFDKYESPDFGEGFQKDESLEKWFRETSHKRNFSNQQFKEFYNDYVEFQKKQVEEHGNKTKALYGEQFDETVKVAKRAFDKLPDDVKKQVEPFIGYDPVVTQILNAFGSRLGESQSPQGGSGGGEGLTDLESQLKKIEESKDYVKSPELQKQAFNLRVEINKARRAK